MMEQIGATAGLIWNALQKENKLALSKVPKAIDHKEWLTYLALGWLARENKVEFEIDGKRTYVSLTGTER
jgi:hypothetical protein